MTEELIKSKKYLDSDGLSIVIDKFKDYISDKIAELYGDDIKLRADEKQLDGSVKVYPTITDSIDNINETLGTTTDNIEQILEAYVKTISEGDQSNQYVSIELDKNSGEITISIDESALSDTINAINEYEINGQKISSNPDLTGEDIKVTTDKNSVTIKDTIDALNDEIETINEYTINDKNISDSPVLTGVDIKVTTDKNSVTIKDTIDALNDEIETINEYTINDKNISDSPVLTGADIKVTTDKNSVTIENAIGTLNDKIEDLNGVVRFQGILDPGQKIEDQKGMPGDIWIVDTKEYICIENIKGENDVVISKWELLGDVTEITDLLESHVGDFKNHKHTFSIDIGFENNDNYTIDSIFTGDEDLETEPTETQHISINHITAPNELPTVEEAEVSLSTHTHKTEVTPSGTVTSEFTGTPKSHDHTFEGNTENTENSSLSISYNLGTLTINTSHNHLYTPSGNILETEITPEGTVKSDFDGNTVEWESTTGNASQKINHVTDVGTQVQYDNIEIPSTDHIHKYTPSGEVTVKISYDGETGTPIQEE